MGKKYFLLHQRKKHDKIKDGTHLLHSASPVLGGVWVFRLYRRCPVSHLIIPRTHSGW